MEEQAEQQKEVLKGFRLQPEETERLNKAIRLAHPTGRITEPTLQAYVLWCLNLGDADLRRATGY